MNIVLAGHVCIDENVSENASYTSWGSALMYIAAYYKSQNKYNISLIAPYGEDFLPYLNDVSILNTSEGKHTLIYKNVSRYSKRTQRCENIEYAPPVPLDDNLKKSISEADIIILAPLLPNYSIKYITELLSNKEGGCLTALFPQGYFRNISSSGQVLHRDFHEALGLLPLFDMMILSEDDISGASNFLQLWAQQNPSTKIIMTQGDKGASWVTENEIIHIGTIPVPEEEIVDTVGCGDTFSAAAIHNYFYSRDVKAAIHAGNEAASEKLRHVSPAGN